MEFKGTKGKFEVIEHNWSDTSLVCGEKTIATISIYDEATEETQEDLENEVSANFMLLSKAPEMLEMLQKIYKIENAAFGLKSFNVEDLKRKIERVIKNATEL